MTNFLHAKYDSSGTQIDDPTVVIGQPSYATDTSGNVTGLVGPGGVMVPLPKITRLGLIGDSRLASCYDSWVPTVASIATNVITLTAASGDISAQGLGTLQVGDSIIVSMCTGIEYIRATIATADGTTGVTATINYPSQNVTGNVFNASVRVSHVSAKPTGTSSALAWLLALKGHPIDSIKSHAFVGAKLQHMVTYQADDAIAQGCDAVVIYGSANDYLTTGGNKSVSYCTQKITELWTKLGNKIVIHLLENPLGSTYATTTNKERNSGVNAWILANAPSYGVLVLDQYTPMLDSTTGAIKTGYSNDGLHPSLAAALNAGIYLSALPIPLLKTSTWIASTMGQGTVQQPALNPTMQGTLGASQNATSVTTGVSGGVTIVSYQLLALANGNQEQEYTLSASAAGSMQATLGGMTVVANAKYRMRGRVRVTNALGLKGFDAKLFNTSGGVLIKYVFGQNNIVAASGANGTYSFCYDQIVTIPAGVTAVYMNLRPWFDAAGSATVGFSELEFIPAPT